MPKETQSTPWVAVITVAVIIMISIVLTYYLTVTGRITILPDLAGNATVGQGGTLKVTVMAFGATYRITGIASLGRNGTVVACRLTEAYINNTQASSTPPWVLRSGQSAVFILSDCVTVSQVVVSYDNGRVLPIPVRG